MLRLKQIVVCSAMGFTLCGLTQAQTIQINRDNKTIAISTTDEATATADIAGITIGFEIFGPDSQAVSADGGKLSHAILETLHKAGVDDKAIESSAQGVVRNRDFDDNDTADQRAKRQFVLKQSWQVNTTPQSAAEVIRVAIAKGANTSGAIEWRLSDRKSLQAKATEAALMKAREVAARMAEGLNVKLGNLIYASNETPDTKIYFAHPAERMTLENFSEAREIVEGQPLEIRPQTIREEATVYAVFSIE